MKSECYENWNINLNQVPHTHLPFEISN